MEKKLSLLPDEEIHVKKNNLHVIYLNSEKIAWKMVELKLWEMLYY